MSVNSVTNFIRPEDVPLYEEYFDGLKLATRVSRGFARIIDSYVKGSYSGNLPELLEPNHADLFYPKVIENKGSTLNLQPKHYIAIKTVPPAAIAGRYRHKRKENYDAEQ